MIRYAFAQYDGEKMSRAIGNALPISEKHAAMVCNAVRGKNIERAKTILQNAISKKEAIKFTKHNMDLAHKRKIGPGRYPVKTCEHILYTIESAEANARQKNLENLFIKHICVHRASKPWHFGRQKRRKMKRANVEVVLSSK